MTTIDKLPIKVTPEVHNNPYIISGLATRAFTLANYDMSPDNPVEEAIQRGLIVVEAADEV